MSFVADIFGARSAAKGQQRAAQAATDASNASLAEQRRQYDLSRADQMPWLTQGTNALNSYASLLGQNGRDAQINAEAQFYGSPDYTFRQNEQARALTARNAALGIQDSGAAQRSAMRYSGQLAAGEFNNYANRLAGLAGVGQTAASNNAQLGAGYANAVTNINQNKAQALGSSYINQGNIYGNLFSGFGGLADRAASYIPGYSALIGGRK